MENNILALRLAKAIQDNQITMLTDEFQLFVVDNGQEPIAIITRDTEGGEVIYYGVYVAKVINDNDNPIHNALDQVQNSDKWVDMGITRVIDGQFNVVSSRPVGWQPNESIVVEIGKMVDEVTRTVAKFHGIDQSRVNRAKTVAFCIEDINWWMNDGVTGDIHQLMNAIDNFGVELVEEE